MKQTMALIALQQAVIGTDPWMQKGDHGQASKVFIEALMRTRHGLRMWGASDQRGVKHLHSCKTAEVICGCVLGIRTISRFKMAEIHHVLQDGQSYVYSNISSHVGAQKRIVRPFFGERLGASRPY